MWSSKRTKHRRLSIGDGRKLQKTLDQVEEYLALLTDFSKAFDCLPHDLIFVKLYAYGFSLETLELIRTVT